MGIFEGEEYEQVVLELTKEEIAVSTVNDLIAIAKHFDEFDLKLSEEQKKKILAAINERTIKEKKGDKKEESKKRLERIQYKYLMDYRNWTALMFAQFLMYNKINKKKAFFLATDISPTEFIEKEEEEEWVPIKEKMKKELASTIITRAARKLGRERINTQMNKRANTIKEIISTEESYIEQLNTVIKFVLNPIKKESILSSEQIKLIFSDITTIYSVNEQFLKLIKSFECQDYANVLIGQIFNQMGPLFKMYADYCMNYHESDILIRQMEAEHHPFISWYSKQVFDNASPQYKKFKISAFLITPVQRLPRYKLLLADLLKYTPACHPDHENVKQALKLITEVTITVNNNTKKREMFEKMKEYQMSITNLPEDFKINNGSRELLAEGKALEIKKKNAKPMALILFNDLLMVCEYIEKGVFTKTQKKKLCFNNTLKLLDMSFAEVKENEIEAKGIQVEMCLVLMISKQKFIFSFISIEEKEKWYEYLSNAIEKEKIKQQQFEARAKTAAMEKAEMARNLIQNKFNTFNAGSMKTRRWKDRGASVASMSFAEKYRMAEEIKNSLEAPSE
ncbi:spermatogenesis-associated protein, putative [Entamoeba dispar SAW760]|uniref:Spermatogenesis-associated protein, putative n=1 Tax=Entamoeba dispar (strain ATCC PRA-260 / SAW760) TaxID=370354 RepID=B0EPZ4_ENTDS|nr:spermatogenesis-associated protein, putative [Entamoeba dispar SAW760]EDR23406.1 spermatogenesis-associated protein, putative [Entamoeba dispar SAW760]|eukprot:EDR23406.1 spermatogenesis-associated protein, putative [Entamoeba dispar SAW760]